MTTMKSLEKRLKAIPEPDLTRLQSEENRRWLEQFPRERLFALHALGLKARNAGRTLTPQEMAAVLGITLVDADPKSQPHSDTKPSAGGGQ